MAARKGGLGKGLDALIPGDYSPSAAPVDSFVLTENIIPNPRQPRDSMNPDDLQDLANSIREHGIIQPLIVTHEPMSDTYVLIAGERRLQAARLVGLEKVPVVIRSATDQERLELALIENVQRADLSPLETAEAYRKLADEFNLSHEEIAARVGKGRVAVTNTMRLLKLPEQAKKALAEGRISEGHGRALLGLPTPQAQLNALQTILHQELNVRQTEELIRKLGGQKPASVPAKETDPEVKEIEERLCEKLGTRVTLKHGKKGGTVTIHYYSEEELSGLLNRLIPG